VDIDEESLVSARAHHPEHRFQSSLPPPEPAFDTVVSLAVIEHVPDPAAFLIDLAARLRSSSESRIVCTTPHPAVDWVHTAGASIGLFSRHANQEHEQLLDAARLAALAKGCSLQVSVYRRFLFGANQLAVFQPAL
jgi:2-polyprenyl-3-methyl-5-hydroxy-6-metoxy-1,4-benzoquinol methylase